MAVAPAIDLTDAQRRTVLALLSQYLPNTTVWAYGSRVKWTSRPASDLDLVVFAAPSQSARLAELREAFDESNLPFCVDLFVWDETPKDFRKRVEAERVVLAGGDVDKARKASHSGDPISDWRDVAIGAVAELVGGGTPSTKEPANFDGDVAWLTPRDLAGVHDRFVARGARNITQLGLQRSSAKLVPTGSVLLTTRAPVGYVALAKNSIATNQGFRSLIPSEKVVAEFLYYWLLVNTPELERHATGSTFKELSGRELAKITLPLPSKSEQRRIVAILGALDDKIELNRRMAATLEETVRPLFKSWFLDRPVQELSGWRSWRLKEIATHSKVSVSPYREPEKTYEHYSIPAYDAGRQPVVGSGLAIKSNKTVIPKNAVLVSKLNPSKPRVWVPDCHGVLPKIASTEFLVFVPKMGFGRGLLWAIFTSRAFQQGVQGLATGTSGSHQRASPSEVANLECIVGDADVFATFESIVGPLVDEQVLMTTESRALADLRDTLLPKLVSGEIRIQDAEKIVEAKT